MISGLGGRFVFKGEFYRWKGDTSDEMELIYTCKCDIQESDRRTSYTIQKVGYAVYFPMKKDRNGKYILPVTKGDYFVCKNMFGTEVNGNVKSCYPSRLGFAIAYLEDKDFEEDNR